MSDTARATPKTAALIALRRAEQEAEPVVVAALISIAIKQVEAIEELARPRRKKATQPTTEST